MFGIHTFDTLSYIPEVHNETHVPFSTYFVLLHSGTHVLVPFPYIYGKVQFYTHYLVPLISSVEQFVMHYFYP